MAEHNDFSVPPNGHGNGESEPHMSAMESPTKPWYLSTKAIFRLVNKVAHSIAHNDPASFDQAIFGLNTVTNIIGDKLAARSLVIDLETAHELIERLDALRSEQFIMRNDGMDVFRGRFASSVRNLLANVTAQKNMASEFLSERASVSGGKLPTILLNDTTGSVAVQVPGLLDRTMSYIQPVLDQVQTRFPEAYLKLTIALQQLQLTAEAKRVQLIAAASSSKSSCCGLLNRVENRTKIQGVKALQTAQPYLHNAYVATAPTVTAAMDSARPYLESMKALLARTVEARDALLHHPTVGPYVTYALDRLYLAIELAKLYVALGDPAAAVSGVVSGAVSGAVSGVVGGVVGGAVSGATAEGVPAPAPAPAPTPTLAPTPTPGSSVPPAEAPPPVTVDTPSPPSSSPHSDAASRAGPVPMG